jgi:outer membrane protein OmpA-like peptidoglycan-associated protein
MKKLVLCFLILIPLFSNAQNINEKPKSRLKITPYFGLGLKLPEKQEIITGDYQMTQVFTYKNIGNYIDNDGKEVSSFTTTNRLGLNLGFYFTDKLELHVGANRLNIITSYSAPFDVSVANTPISTINGSYSFLSVTGGLKYHVGPKSWINLEGQFTPDYLMRYRKDLNSSGSGGGDNPYVNSNGNGLEFSGVTSPVTTLSSVYFGVGTKSIFDLNVELGLSIGLKTTSITDVSYIQNFRKVGNSHISESASAIFLSVQQPINLGFKKRVKTPKPPKPPKPEKIKTPKKEKETPKPKEKESYEFKDKVIFKGDDIVLDNIKFDQSKSDLLLPGMKELDDVYELLKKYPEAKVALTGHTSQEGNRKDNINLSEDRAKACKSYLVKKGIKSSRIQAFGIGPDKPVSTTNSELNRRVEIKVF